VEDALELIVMDFVEYLIPGTNLVDYGPDMDGFSPTYKHVMPGCSQGNNVWMLRDFATFRDTQGRTGDAAMLRKHAAALSSDAMKYLYNINEKGHGWFNVIHPVVPAAEPVGDQMPSDDRTAPPPPPPAATSVVSNEMRHVVDMFSMTFGLCGLADNQPCDFSDKVRGEIASWFRNRPFLLTFAVSARGVVVPNRNALTFYTDQNTFVDGVVCPHHRFREESLTSTWIRATSPLTNCSVNFTLPYSPTVSATPTEPMTIAEAGAAAPPDSKYPGFDTCKADRPDHGTTGAYPSWPAFSVEALCYLDGNCAVLSLSLVLARSLSLSLQATVDANAIPRGCLTLMPFRVGVSL
jgi:hypothetical protein